MRRHACEIYIFNPAEDEAVRIVKVRGKVRANVLTRKLLAPHERQCTAATYHEVRRYLWSASVWYPGGSFECFEAPRVVGQSVGERGVW